MISSKLLTPVLGSAFILGGILYLLPNPDLAPNNTFGNTGPNILHIVAGIAIWIGGKLGHRRNTILATGLAFVVITIIGSFTDGTLVPGMIHVGIADRWFHAMLALLLLVVGVLATRDEKVPPSRAPQLPAPLIEHERLQVPYERIPPKKLPGESL